MTRSHFASQIRAIFLPRHVQPFVRVVLAPDASDVPKCGTERQICNVLRLRRAALGLMILGATTVAAPAARAQDAMQGYYGIRPGMSTKAQVDLSVGEPLRKISADEAVFEYSPMKEDAFSRRVVIRYESETSEVARLDAYLKTPLTLSEIRDRFGTRVIARDRDDGAREEVYYPQLQALIFSSKAPDAPVVAISHLSPRTMGWIYVGRFDEMLAQKSLDEARTEADKAVVVDPDGGEGYLAQGRYFMLQQNYNEAMVRFTAASNAKYSTTDKYRAQLAIASVHEATNAPDKAQASYRRAIDVAPPSDRPDAHFRYGTFLNSQKKVDEALAAFTKAIELSPKHAAARHAVADVYWDKDDYARAFPHFEALSQESEKVVGSDKNGVLHFRYAYCLAHMGKDALAIVEYEKGLQLSGPRAAGLNNLGLLYVKAGNHAKAIEGYRTAIGIEPKDLLLNLNLAEALLKGGQTEEAKRQAELTVGLKPDDGRAAFTVARCWAVLKKKKETLHWLQRALASGFKDRKALTTDQFLARMQDDGNFKKLLLQLQ